MSQGSVDPIIENMADSLNRDQSFHDMTMLENDSRHKRKMYHYIRNITIFGCVLFIVMGLIMVYLCTTFHHLQLDLVAFENQFKRSEEARRENEQTCKTANLNSLNAKSIVHDVSLSLERLKILVNMQGDMVTQKDETLDDLRSEMKINQIKTSNLEKNTERIFLKLFDRSTAESNHEDLGGLSPKNASVVIDNMSSGKSNENESSFAIAFNLTNKRVDGLEAELQLLQIKCHDNSQKLRELLNEPKLNSLDAFSNRTSGARAMITDLRKSIDKLRFGRRCAYP